MSKRLEGSKLKDELKKKRFRIDNHGPFRIWAIELNDPLFDGEASYDFIPAEFNVNSVTKADISGSVMTLPKSWVMNKGKVMPWIADGGRRKTRRHRKLRKITRRRRV